MRSLLIALLSLVSVLAKSQTRERWEQVVNWDGVSNWSRYLITLPGYQGPNSLPVPQLGNGRIDSSSYLGITGAFHFSKGDNTQNIVLTGHIGLVKDVVDVEVTWIPYEHFSMSTAIKEKRHVYYDYFKENSASGDIYMNTNFRIFKKWSPVVDLLLQVGYRFPSGTDYGAARYSDGPGYHFAFNAGKALNEEKTLRLTAMAGFHVWQIESDVFKQDDSFLFGAGLDWDKNNFRIQANLAGYIGYLEKQGDKPIVFRTRLEKKRKKMSWVLGFQQGLKDFDYSSVDFGARFLFQKH